MSLWLCSSCNRVTGVSLAAPICGSCGSAKVDRSASVAGWEDEDAAEAYNVRLTSAGPRPIVVDENGGIYLPPEAMDEITRRHEEAFGESASSNT